jgi:hypothetical protein
LINDLKWGDRLIVHGGLDCEQVVVMCGHC